MALQEVLAPLQGFFLVVSFVLGTMIGSFCNVCISRWPSGDSVISPRSRCPKCKNAITWYDNIPILSWLVLGAKCRHCSLPISWVYPLVEALTGLLFLAVFWRFGFVLATPIYMALCACMVIATFQDLADWTIPNEITLPGIPAGLVLSLVAVALGEETGLRVVDPLDALGGVVLGGGILYVLDVITVTLLKKPGMGFGDVKLLAMLGAFIGWKGVLITLMLASILGSVVGLSMILYFKLRGEDEEAPEPEAEAQEAAEEDTEEEDEGAVEEDDEAISLQGHYLPFGPYLAVAGIVYVFFGPEVIQMYVDYLQPAPMQMIMP